MSVTISEQTEIFYGALYQGGGNKVEISGL
jgi:hypothetical protein